MNSVSGGPNGVALADIANGNGTAHVMLIWDHSNVPACSQPAAEPGKTEPCPFVGVGVSTHYPRRHGGRFNVLYCDGHAVTTRAEELDLAAFYAR